MRHSRRFWPSGKERVEGARETMRTLAQVGQTDGRGVLVGDVDGQERRRGVLQRSIVVICGLD